MKYLSIVIGCSLFTPHLFHLALLPHVTACGGVAPRASEAGKAGKHGKHGKIRTLWLTHIDTFVEAQGLASPSNGRKQGNEVEPKLDGGEY